MTSSDRAGGTDLIDRLARLRGRPALVVVGLMSGTSADGTDAVVVRFPSDSEREFRLLAVHSEPHPEPLRRRILDAASADARALARLDFDLGERFASCARAAIAAAGLAPTEVDLIGSHGQTVVHVPPDRGRPGATLQLGEAAVIAERTGVAVVSDFRVRDVAAGGHGAPLVPYVDHLLFARRGEKRVLVNIGGIANLTGVTERIDDVVAFDVGPGNALLDALVRLATNGAETFDRDGARSLRGTVDAKLLADLVAHPFLAEAPPKSADRDAFGAPLARRLIAERPDLALDDLLATAAAFTAEGIARGIALLAFDRVDAVIASGGGVLNAAVMREIAARVPGVPIATTDVHGIPSEAKEALAFAILAREFIRGKPANLPRVTGAARAVVLGAFTP